MAATPYRIVLSSAQSSGQLRGVAGTRTAGIVIDGSYNEALGCHEFAVSVTGRYKLYEDPAGGSNYTEVTAWGGPDGKLIVASDLADELETHVVVGGEYYASVADAVAAWIQGEMRLTPGTFDVQPTLEIGSQRRLVGSGPDISVVRVRKQSSEAAVGVRVNGSDVVVRGLSLYGEAQNANAGDVLLEIVGAANDNVLVEDCVFDHLYGGWAIRIAGPQHVTIRNCTFNVGNGAAGAILISGGGDDQAGVFIEGCKIAGWAQSGAVRVDVTDGSTVDMVEIRGVTVANYAGDGIVVYANGSAVRSPRVRGCYVGAAVGGACVRLDGILRGPIVEGNMLAGGDCGIHATEYATDGAVIAGNTVRDCGVGIRLNAINASHMAVVRGNVVEEPDREAIHLYGYGSAKVVIADNVVKGANAGGGSASAIYVQDGGLVMLLGNSVFAVSGATPVYGVRVEGGDTVVVAGNSLSGASNENLSLSGVTTKVVGTNDAGGLNVLSGFWGWSGEDFAIQVADGDAFKVASPLRGVMLELRASDGALVNLKKLVGIPALTTAERDALTDVPTGALIYNSEVGSLQFWDGSQWKTVETVVS